MVTRSCGSIEKYININPAMGIGDGQFVG